MNKAELAEKILSQANYLRCSVNNGRHYSNPNQVAMDDIEQIREYLDELEIQIEEEMELEK